MISNSLASTFMESVQSPAGVNFRDDEVDLQGVLMEAQSLIARHEYNLAFFFLDAFIETLEASGLYAHVFRDDSTSEHRAFRNPFEEVLYHRLHKPEREVLPVPEELFGLYMLHGCLLFELERYDEAGMSLEKAVRLNPVNCEPLLELAEIRKIHGNCDGLLTFTKQAHEVAYTRQDLGRCYRNLGYYHN